MALQTVFHDQMVNISGRQVTDRSRLGTARQFNDENFMKAVPFSGLLGLLG